MAAFIASYTGPTGQPRTVTIKATDVGEAKKLLRREASVPMNCGRSPLETPMVPRQMPPQKEVWVRSTSTACLKKHRA